MNNPQNNNGAAAVPDSISSIVPQDPKTLRRWLAFKLTPRADGSVDKKPTNVVTGSMAASDDPNTWASYEDARAYCAANESCVLGFALGEDIGLVVVDFDKLRTTTDEPWPAWAEREIEQIDSFTEESCSGLGKHVWCWATIPTNRNNQKCHVELHGSKKMFAVTEAFAEEWQKIRPRDLSELYRRIDEGKIGPDYKAPITAAAYNSQKFRDLCSGEWEKHFNSRSEAVASVLCTLAGKHQGNAEAMRAAFEATKLCEIWDDKWDRLGDREIERAVKWYEEKRAKGEPEPLAFEFPAVDGTDYDYVMAPADGQMDGWFPLGDFSLIGGASGANKTTWALQMLTAQRRREPVHSHATYGRPFLLLLEDRGPRALRRTLRRMRLDERDVPHTMLRDDVPVGRPGLAVKVAVEDWKRKHGDMPQIVLVEGLDLLVKKAGEMDSAAAALKELQAVTAYYHLSVIGTVGAPKMKPKEQYTNYRERIFGSIAWGRKAETIVALSCVCTDADPERVVVFLPRNAPAEKYDLEMVAGRLAPRVAPVEMDALELWMAQQPGKFTRADAVEAMKAADTGMKRSTVYNRVKKLLQDGHLKADYDRQSNIEYLCWLAPEPSTPAEAEAETAAAAFA